jgi:membrane associated rhomboid family serine protease/Zn-finger nucleic acid-binding protein
LYTCPRCDEALTRCQTKGGVYWKCARCEGRTATVAMLRNATDPDLISQLWAEAQLPEASYSLPCPACRSSMRAVWLPASNRNSQLDVCTLCQLVWFDQGEYDRVPTAAGDPAWRSKDVPLEARLAMVKMYVEGLDPRPDMKLDTSPPAEDWKAIPAFFGLPVTQESSSSLSQSSGTVSIAIGVLAIGLLGIYVAPQAYQDFGFIPAQASRNGFITVVTSLLLHGSLPHLLISTYFLLMFGVDVEHLFGTGRFLILFVASAVCGDYVHTLLNPESAMPLLGIGPAVSGLLAAYALRLPRARIGFAFPLPLALYQWVNLPAWVYIVFWIFTQAVGLAIGRVGVIEVSWSAHLGGAFAGALLGAMMSRRPAAPIPAVLTSDQQPQQPAS